MTVDKNLFQSLLYRYASSTSDDVEQVLALKAQYPYSQLLSALTAKLLKDHNFDGHQHELQMAAIRSGDRTVLKEVMENEIMFDLESVPAPVVSTVTMDAPNTVIMDQAVGGEPQASITPADVEGSTLTERRLVTYENVVNPQIDSTDMADQVMRDLAKLNVSRHNFEMLFVEYAEVKGSDSTETSDGQEVAHHAADSPDSVREKESSKSRKQRIIELAKARQATPSAAIESLEETKKKRNVGDGKASPNEELMKEIITSKEEITPDTPKQKEQIDIINHFIKAQPSITSAKERQPAPSADLNPIKTGEFGDNIVSETLVEILIKQGKKEKAVEVLKKLIWKYPQKKAYFASQIEELKK
jgi:hypothetical protein